MVTARGSLEHLEINRDRFHCIIDFPEMPQYGPPIEIERSMWRIFTDWLFGKEKPHERWNRLYNGDSGR